MTYIEIYIMELAINAYNKIMTIKILFIVYQQ